MTRLYPAASAFTYSGGGDAVAAETSTFALPQFLRYLSTLPRPDDLARALRLGPMGSFGTQAISIVRIAGESLELIGTHGYEQAEVDRYSLVPLSVPTPFSRSVLQGEALIDELEDVLSTFEVLQMDEDLWSGFLERFGPGQVINSPIVLQGTVIGAFGGITRSKREWSSLDFAVLDGISSALGLWMTHPDTAVAAPDRLATPSNGSMHITNRQASILRLVESGRSNTSIAMTLGYSVSTVKQELQRTMRAMRVSDRLEAAARARSLGLLSEDDEH